MRSKGCLHTIRMTGARVVHGFVWWPIHQLSLAHSRSDSSSWTNSAAFPLMCLFVERLTTVRASVARSAPMAFLTGYLGNVRSGLSLTVASGSGLPAFLASTYLGRSAAWAASVPPAVSD